jgi:hypothetical protein
MASTTLTWLFALHLFFTYAPKAVEIANGVQQFEQQRKVNNNPFSGAKSISVGMKKVKRKSK